MKRGLSSFYFPAHVWPYTKHLQSIENLKRWGEREGLVIQCSKIFITISGRVIGVLDPNCIAWKKIDAKKNPLQKQLKETEIGH